MGRIEPRVLYEDNHCLAVDKPAGWLSQGDRTGDAAIPDWAADYLRTKHGKPGNVYVGLVHRLDRPVSGILLLARTSKAAARLSEETRRGGMEKWYLALVEGGPAGGKGVLRDRIGKDAASNRATIWGEGAGGGEGDGEEGGRAAWLEYWRLERAGGLTLLAVRLGTGRGHQIRAQLASRGWPIVGDAKYGARGGRLRASDGGWRIALHAGRLVFTHPTRKDRVRVTSGTPADWPEGWRGRGFGFVGVD